jgi:glycine cleavage system aminomethyltransferase T
LKKLHQYGVYIDLMSVRKAILDRFIVYYGPGMSTKAYNQQARENNELSLDEMIEKMNEALGLQMFQGPEVRDTIEKRGHARIRRNEIREQLTLRSPFKDCSTGEKNKVVRATS